MDEDDNSGRQKACDPTTPGRVSGNNFGKHPTSGPKRTLDVPEYLKQTEPVGRPRNGDR